MPRRGGAVLCLGIFTLFSSFFSSFFSTFVNLLFDRNCNCSDGAEHGEDAEEFVHCHGGCNSCKLHGFDIVGGVGY